jgi:hypothetical protein
MRDLLCGGRYSGAAFATPVNNKRPKAKTCFPENMIARELNSCS